MRALILLCLLSLTACSVVGPQQRGVRVVLGTVSEEPKAPGVYLWVPFVISMHKIDITIQNEKVSESSSSKDMQEITAEVAVNWSLSAEKVVETYKTIGDEDDIVKRILIPAVNEVMKASTAKRTAEEVLSQRMALKKDIDDGLLERLARYGITLHDVNIVNLRFSKDFENAIERKQVAEQEAKQAEYTTLKAVQDAKAEVAKARGQAEAQNLLKTTLTHEILESRAIDKWNGVLPQVTNGATPFINVGAK